MLQTIEYQCDGVTLRGRLALPAGYGRHAGLLVGHEGTGMTEHIEQKAAAFAELGYAAFVPDLYGECFPPEEALARYTGLMSAPGLMLSRARAGLTAFRQHENVDPCRLAMVGYCMGGVTALELARAGAPLRCVIGFHPGLARPAGSEDGPIAAKVLMMIGSADPVVPEPARATFIAEMEAACADWQLHVFGGVGHSFTNPAASGAERPGFRYDAVADARSWEMATAMLRRELPVDEDQQQGAGR